MLLLGPLVLLLVGGLSLARRAPKLPSELRPLLGYGAIAMVMLTSMQLITNQFAIDRDGFRTWVLSAAPRREILLGKNVSLAAIVMPLAVGMLVIVQIALPVSLDRWLAALLAIGPFFLLSCLLGNLTSILMPITMSVGSLKPAHPSLGTVVIQLGMLLVLPVVGGIAMLPLLVDLVVRHVFGVQGLPIQLGASLIELGLAFVAYRAALPGLGRLLHAREREILQVVAARQE
jgi:hypothetical protein